MTIEHVSDTARWVAVYRAMESERPDAIFTDPYARRLAGEKGAQIVREMKRGVATAWAMIVRTAVMDEIIKGAMENGVDTVVNLAAGLDARPWRLGFPASFRWVDVDFAGILDYKLDVLRDETPRCDYRALRADLTDGDARRQVLAAATAGSSRALVVTEGLLLYLERADVVALATDLHATAPIQSWLTDLASPRLLKMMQGYWGKGADQGNASFKFAPEEGTAFFAPYGWMEKEYRSTSDEARRLDREMRGAGVWRFITAFMPRAKREEARRMAGVLLLDRS